MTPAQRRSRGDGSLTEIKPGVWRLRVFVGTDPVNGKVRQASRNFRGTRTEALKALRVLAGEVDDGKHQVARARSVADLLTVWQKQLEDLRPLTRQSYAVIIAKHLTPALGKVELRKLNAFTLDNYYQAKRAEGLAPRSIRLHHAIMSSALSRAVKWEWVGTNAAKSASPPKIPQGKGVTPGVAEVRKLLEAAEGNVDLKVMVVLAAITGARRGELAGLQWGDVDWDAGRLLIQRQRVPVKGGNETGPLKHGDERTVTLGALGLAVLRQYRQDLEGRAVMLGVDVGPWVLTDDCGVTPIRAQFVGESIARLGRRAGVPVTTHAFRRFAATAMVNGGVDIVTTAFRLGHTPEVLIQRYAGVIAGSDSQAADMLELGVLGPAPLTQKSTPGT